MRAATRKKKEKTDRLHRRSVVALQDADIPFLIGGAYVVEVYAGVSRHTKDFDLYLRPQHVDLALDALKRAGYKTKKTFPHWLAKAGRGRDYVDLIFRAGNGLCEVDDSWFERAHTGDFLGSEVKAVCARGNDLDEGVHYGTRTVRRRRHCAHPSKLRRETRLAAPGSPIWSGLASAA